MSYELLIQHGSSIMLPPVVEGVTIEWERQGQPGKLTFECVKTDGLSFQEGDPCRFSVDGKPVFYGFVFEKTRKGSNPNVIKCVVYDQLYYDEETGIISLPLTQEDTLAFNAQEPLWVQLRLRDNLDNAAASDPFRVDVGEIFKDGVI